MKNRGIFYRLFLKPYIFVLIDYIFYPIILTDPQNELIETTLIRRHFLLKQRSCHLMDFLMVVLIYEVSQNQIHPVFL